MNRLFLFESGSTKTTVLVCDVLANLQNNGAVHEFNLSGYNPNRNSQSFIEELKRIETPPTAEDHVYFYGSGLASVQSKVELKTVFKNQFEVEITVYDDMLGAARALYKNQAGVFAIMGTGGVAGFYDGNSVTARKGGYGYLIDDIGGGYELGKRVVSAWLNAELPESLEIEIAQLLKCNRESFTNYYYKQPDLGYNAEGLMMIADTVRLIGAYQNHTTVAYLLENYFTEFFRRHVLTLCEINGERELKICGSLAEIFYESIHTAATKLGIELKGKLRYPAQYLLEYHLYEIE